MGNITCQNEIRSWLQVPLLRIRLYQNEARKIVLTQIYFVDGMKGARAGMLDGPPESSKRVLEILLASGSRHFAVTSSLQEDLIHSRPSFPTTLVSLP
jgi:hypothetical protein